MIAFVTGATSFFGEALVRQLLAEGHRVRALIPPEDDAGHLSDLKFERVPGEFSSIDALRVGAAGAHVIFHSGAAPRSWYHDKDTWRRVNMIGTKTLVTIAHRAKVERIVMVGGMEVAMRLPTPYGRTRFQAMEAAFQSNFEGFHKEMEILAVHPGVLVGPRDRRPSEFGRLLIDILEGRSGWLPRGGLPLVDVEDAARNAVLTARRGCPGAEYNLVGEYFPLDQILGALSAVTGRLVSARLLPKPLAHVAGALEAIGARFARKEPRLSRGLVGILTRQARAVPGGDQDRRVLDLGPYRPVEESLARAIAWWIENGKLSRERVYY